MSFTCRWSNSCQDVILAAKVAQQKCPADYEEIARVLSPAFSEDKNPPVMLSGRACREKMNGHISKYLEDKKALKG